MKAAVAAIISMLVEAAIADYFAEIEAELANDNRAHPVDLPEARTKPDPENKTSEATA